MKNTALLFAAILASSALVASYDAFAQPKGSTKEQEKNAEQKTLSLALGESRQILVPDVKNYLEGPAGVAKMELTPDGKKFVITGSKAGTTSLLLIKNDGSQINWTINVYSQAPEQVEVEIRTLLDGYAGLRIRRIGSRVFIEGGVANEQDQARIKQVADAYGGQVESLVTVKTGAIDRKLNIRIDCFFVQYNKNSSYDVGISMPARIGGGAIQSTFGYDFVTKVPTATAAIVDQPLPGLDIAQSNGWAKVLKQSTVITTNGNEATFENGGELNFAIAKGLTSTIEKISFGTNVTVLPRYDPQTKNLEVVVKTDVSDLTPPEASDLPGRQTAKLNTMVFLKLGQSLVLSGIRTRGQRHQVKGLPGLSQIPILGLFFGSHVDAADEIEGAVFIIPSVVESVPKSSYDIVKEAMKEYSDYSGSINSADAYQKKPPGYGQ